MSFFSYSQDEISKSVILSNSNLENLKILSETFLNNSHINEDEINNYIEAHSDVMRKIIIKGKIYELYKIIDGKPVYLSTDNADEAKATKTNTLNTGGELGLDLNGENMLIGVWDGGLVLKSHVEFQNETNTASRISTPETAVPNPASQNHATHVAGTITATGLDSGAKGMAPKANLLSYDWTSDLTEVTNEIVTNGLLISNHSYGVPVLDSEGDLNVPAWYMGCYNSDAVSWDQVAYDAPYYLMVASAGNSGADSYSGGLQSGYDKLTGEKNSKNNLVVANANPTVFPTGFMNVVINSSSSQGPSDDGRIKPDIAGDGTSVYSTYNTSNTSYGNMTGTSMAAPNVAGSILLLQQHYYNLSASFMRSSTLKGLICHNAYDPSNPGPDAKFGWGLLDAKESALTLSKSFDSTPTAIVNELILNDGDQYEFDVVVSTPQKLTATICWIDVPGTAKDNQLNSSTPVLVNDLDLRIINSVETNYPWKLQLSDVSLPAIKGDNIVDNVEKVEVENASGNYTVQVSHKGVLVNGAQAYSLIVSGFDQILLNNDDFDLNNSIIYYPNPTNDLLNIKSPNVLIKKYEVIDVQGRIMESKNINRDVNELQINLQDYSEGIYYVKIFTEFGTHIKNILKK